MLQISLQSVSQSVSYCAVTSQVKNYIGGTGTVKVSTDNANLRQNSDTQWHSCKFAREEIMGAYNFNFVNTFMQGRMVSDQNFALLEKNFLDKKKIDNWNCNTKRTRTEPNRTLTVTEPNRVRIWICRIDSHLYSTALQKHWASCSQFTSILHGHRSIITTFVRFWAMFYEQILQLLLSSRLSHRNSVCSSVCQSVRHTGGSVKNGAS